MEDIHVQGGLDSSGRYQPRRRLDSTDRDDSEQPRGNARRLRRDTNFAANSDQGGSLSHLRFAAADSDVTNNITGGREASGSPHYRQPGAEIIFDGQPSGSPLHSLRQRVLYSDRFIPSRSASSFLSLSPFENSSPSASLPPSKTPEDGGTVYPTLLRTELFGADAPIPDPVERGMSAGPGGNAAKVARNLFRYKQEAGSTAGGRGRLSSSISPSGLGAAFNGSAVPRQKPRKIARAPFKVKRLTDLARATHRSVKGVKANIPSTCIPRSCSIPDLSAR